MLISLVSIASLLRSPAVLVAATILVVSALLEGCRRRNARVRRSRHHEVRPPGGRQPTGGAPGACRRVAVRNSIILAASDVKTVDRGTIEAGVSVSGDLKAIEEAVVRARLEGDLVGVYVREGDHVKAGPAAREVRGQRAGEQPHVRHR